MKNYKHFNPPIVDGEEYVPMPTLQQCTACGTDYRFICTLVRGHDGPHVAHGGGNPARMIAKWEDGE